jgi:phospholipase C
MDVDRNVALAAYLAAVGRLERAAQQWRVVRGESPPDLTALSPDQLAAFHELDQADRVYQEARASYWRALGRW